MKEGMDMSGTKCTYPGPRLGNKPPTRPRHSQRIIKCSRIRPLFCLIKKYEVIYSFDAVDSARSVKINPCFLGLYISASENSHKHTCLQASKSRSHHKMSAESSGKIICSRFFGKVNDARHLESPTTPAGLLHRHVF